MTTIKILIYTDKRDIALAGSPLDWNLSTLANALETNTPLFLKYEVQVINRFQSFNGSSPNPEPIRLTTELLQQFDEIWFMGIYQQNEAVFSEPFGGPRNELSTPEVTALETWMNNAFGGVLITGDHADVRQGHPNDPIEKQLALGRAIGHLVPRAGKLRKWQGPPTISSQHAFNTVGMGPVFPTQDDAIPQRLLFDQLDPRGVPHELFWGKDEQGNESFIDVFPDHEHEGGLQIPEPDGDWPPFKAPPGTVKPKAISIASSMNFRPGGGRESVLVVYDGDDLGVGRIVADSSFHHYIDFNLQGFAKSPDQSVLKSITQFFRNLAFYLIPLTKRQEITKAMFSRIASHPAVLEERSNRSEAIGKVAKSYLSLVASPIELNEMVHMLLPPVVRAESGNAFLPEAFANNAPSQELVLGSMISRHLKAVPVPEEAETGTALESTVPIDPFTAGLQDALQSHTEQLKESAADNEKFLVLLSKI
ncbi:MAG TPA: hypothetical protein VF290_17760 [Pyrinomonadaceae bacterium]